MPFWRCTTCAALTPRDETCRRCGGEVRPSTLPRLPLPALLDLREAFRLEAGNAFLLRQIARDHPERETLLALAEEAEQEALQWLYEGELLGLSPVIEALVQARVEAFPRFAEQAERAGFGDVATSFKWSASRKALSASLLLRISP